MSETSGTAETADTGSASRGPAEPSPSASVLWRPIGPAGSGAASGSGTVPGAPDAVGGSRNSAGSRITGGFWAERQHANGAEAIVSGLAQLESFGNLQNMRIAAGIAEGEAIGPVFADSDVYKWLEAVAWEYHRAPSDELLEMQREVTAIVAAAQEDDGYLDSTIQVRQGRAGRYLDLPWSHEHYCAGHLMQAAVAQRRGTGDTALLEVAVKLADHLVATFGPGLTEDIDGHPVIETALVELYRETGREEYLDLAAWFVDARGHGLIERHGKEPTYFSDRVPVRQADTLEGHAVRAVYLAAGAADVAIERADAELLSVLGRQFDDVMATKTYLTGGLGSRWEGEAFGDPFELPPDRAYAETCAAIGGIQWAWRMLLATGEEKYGDAMERMLYNGFLAGVSLGGTEYFYVNPLQLRAHAHPDENRSPAHGRRGWFDCACCPPNIMRLLASLDGYLASYDPAGVQLHTYTPTETAVQLADGRVALRVETDYPWEGRVAVTIAESPATPWTLSLRVPSWAQGATVTVGGESFPARPGEYARVERSWADGEVVTLDLPIEARSTDADPRIDAIRGSTAIERGPLVYALEQVDNDVDIDAVRIGADSGLADGPQIDALLGARTVTAAAHLAPAPTTHGWPYGESRDGGPDGDGETRVTLIPYYAWANRGIGAMRVWMPRV